MYRQVILIGVWCLVFLGGRPAERAFTTAPLDIRQADALILEVFSAEDEARYAEAAEAYLSMIRHLGQALGEGERAILLKHLRWLIPVVPKALEQALCLEKAVADEDLKTLPDDTGERLLLWWRREDTFPATARNERVEEHLRRIAYALETFSTDEQLRGYDDRGEIYIRLGAPYRRVRILIDRGQLIFNFPQAPHIPSFPENEYWVYLHVMDEAQYLFIRAGSVGRPYALGIPYDLVPTELRSGLGTTRRGARKTQILLRVLDDIYTQLALNHPFYAERYNELTFRPEGLPLHSHAFNTLNVGRSRDLHRVEERAERVPASYSETYGRAEPLPVALRWARFLDDDGTTRTELYWSLEAKRLRPSRRLRRRLKKDGHTPTEEYLLSLAVAQQRWDYQTHQVGSTRHLVPAEKAGVLATQTYVARGDTGTYHLGLQWEEQWVQIEQGDTVLEAGPRLKIGAYRLDTLQALTPDPRRLEMSDLKPLLLSGQGHPDALALLEDPGASPQPYPFAGLSADTKIGLHFQVYHLAFGVDDQTHYSVEYEVMRRQKKEGLPGIFGAKDEERTSTATAYVGRSRTATETLLIDLSEASQDGAIEVFVRVTDETTGQQIERSVYFEVAGF